MRLTPGPIRSSTLKRAAEYILTAIRLSEQIHDTEKNAIWKMNMGNIEVLTGNDGIGVKLYEESLLIAKSGGFSRIEAQSHYNLGTQDARMGRYESALKHFRVAHRLLKVLHSPMLDQIEEHIRFLRSKLSK